MDASKALHAILANVSHTLSDVEEFPYIRDRESPVWQTTPDGDWCGGHWIGLLWLAAKHASSTAERDRFLTAAMEYTNTVTRELPRESMFYGLNHYYAGFRGYDIFGDRKLYGLGLRGADAMAEYYNENARQVPLGEFQIRGPDNFRGEESECGPSGAQIGAVDNIYTALPVLWRAYHETKNPVFRDIAISHADRHLNWYIRKNGSTWHHAVFDLETGELEYQYNELAYSDDTCWARGQGWCIAGLARAYRETDAERYLAALERTTAYYTDNSPPDLVAPWDFATPENESVRDTSAAALAAYGLARLNGDSARIAELRSTGKSILNSLISDYLVTEPENDHYGAILHGCYNKPGGYAIDNELIWTDYYVAFTLDYILSS